MIQLNQYFANRNEEDKIYPLTVKEIVEAQKASSTLKQYFKSNAVLDNGLELLLIENKSCTCHK
jgi:predicted AAA+ superfamily ATPase